MSVKTKKVYLLKLVLFAAALRAALFVADYLGLASFPAGITDLLTALFLVISALSSFIFISGGSDPEKRVLKTLVAISLKTLLILIVALFLFVVFKKKNIDTVVLFFILYLGFTLFIVFTMLNTLKKESLKK